MPEPRAAVQRMRPYSPPTGGRHDKLRLDFNENTVGCSPRVADFLRNALTGDLLATYPDYVEVKAALATFFEVDPTELLLTNGTDEAIQVLINTFVEPDEEVIVMNPSYAMYRFYAEVAGARVVELDWERTQPTGSHARQFRFPLQSVTSAITSKTKAIFLANPNNPTGTAMDEAELIEVLEAAPKACVLVDEAYFEFYGRTMLPYLNQFGNLFVSRTFSKAHGMAALRMGCLMSDSANVAAMHKAQSPYSVNMLAALAAGKAIQDREFVSQYVGAALEGRARIEQAFDRLHVGHWQSAANFVLFDAGNWGDECLARCREAGVLVRDRRHEIPGALRVTAGTPEQVDSFVAVVEQILGGTTASPRRRKGER